MALVYSALLPHPKSLLQPGSAAAKKISETANTFIKIKEHLSSLKIETLLLINANPVAPIDPYSPPLAAPDVYAFFGLDKLITGYIPEVKAKTKVFDNNLDLMRELQKRAKPLGLKIVGVPQIKIGGPTSTVVQLLTQDDKNDYRAAVIHLPYKPLAPLVDFGSLLGSLLAGRPEKIAMIGVGNLSARLSKNSPAGYKPEGAAFDKLVASSVKKNDFSALLSWDPAKLEAAGQEAALPLAVISAASSRLKHVRLESYDDSLGIGYGVISWQP